MSETCGGPREFQRELEIANLATALRLGWHLDPRWQEAIQQLWPRLLECDGIDERRTEVGALGQHEVTDCLAEDGVLVDSPPPLPACREEAAVSGREGGREAQSADEEFTITADVPKSLVVIRSEGEPP